ncbi:MAG: hypothetical protein K2X29_09055 [Candidatus Obscuribacterales bacterium]|nr:hypothetical protein [Candidatus Obscuribacterales bacterium]
MGRHIFLEFKECRAMATKIVQASLDVYHVIDFEDLILHEFEEEARSVASCNLGADSSHDNFSDCMSLLNTSHNYRRLLKEHFSDAHHNGSPTRWLKFSNNLALQGKTRSALFIRRTTFRESEPGKNTRYMDCELHQSVREGKNTSIVVTSFSLTAHGSQGWYIDIDFNEAQNNSTFYAFVFPALEALDLKTPTLHTWSGGWKSSQPSVN